MAIVSSQIIRDIPQGDGTRRVVEEHTDHLGEVHRFVYRPAEGVNVSTIMAGRVPVLENRLRRAEITQLRTALQSGADPAQIVRRHLTVRQTVRPVVRALMAADAQVAIRLAKFVKDSITDSILDSETSVAIRTRIRNRITGLIAMETGLADDQALREELEA